MVISVINNFTIDVLYNGLSRRNPLTMMLSIKVLFVDRKQTDRQVEEANECDRCKDTTAIVLHA